MRRLEVIPVEGVPEVGRGDDLAGVICDVTDRRRAFARPAGLARLEPTTMRHVHEGQGVGVAPAVEAVARTLGAQEALQAISVA